MDIISLSFYEYYVYICGIIVILPPGIEELSGITYGELTLSIKKLNYLDVLRKEGNVRVRFNFFGERGAEHILVPSNANSGLT